MTKKDKEVKVVNGGQLRIRPFTNERGKGWDLAIDLGNNHIEWIDKEHKMAMYETEYPKYKGTE